MLIQFWQELKRRRVIHVIIELVNNVTEPQKLPEWTPTMNAPDIKRMTTYGEQPEVEAKYQAAHERVKKCSNRWHKRIS